MKKKNLESGFLGKKTRDGLETGNKTIFFFGPNEGKQWDSTELHFLH